MGLRTRYEWLGPVRARGAAAAADLHLRRRPARLHAGYQAG